MPNRRTARSSVSVETVSCLCGVVWLAVCSTLTSRSPASRLRHLPKTPCCQMLHRSQASQSKCSKHARLTVTDADFSQVHQSRGVQAGVTVGKLYTVVLVAATKISAVLPTISM